MSALIQVKNNKLIQGKEVKEWNTVMNKNTEIQYVTSW